MKFVEKKEEKETQAVITTQILSDRVVVSVDSKNVFCLYLTGKFIVWEKHGIRHLADGTIDDLEE